MNWHNIKLIFRREMRDQLRDRRTLFMIAVLPILFYPLLGITFFQIAQFLQKHPSKILVVGYQPTDAELPNLIGKDGKNFSGDIFDDPSDAKLVEVVFYPLSKLRFVKENKWPKSGELTPQQRSELNEELRRVMQREECDAVVCFPPKFSEQLAQYPKEVLKHTKSESGSALKLPKIVMVTDNTNDGTALGGVRASRVIEKWSEKVRQKSFIKANLDDSIMNPLQVNRQDLATNKKQRFNASLWSKVLPFVLMIWAVTGAFYPAVDLCAGEKERGTLETLLSSPAGRNEIVMGKLFTVMVFSIVTALLNLLTMSITGAIVMKQLGQMPMMANVGPPPFASLVWLAIVIVPVAAMYSAICLALAAFARSTKEGQYYLMPVILFTMPMILLPMAPDAELNLGFSLIPVCGIVLLMRSMMEGTFAELWPYTIPVAAVTFGCCWVSVRWAIEQFSREDVLFREAERFDLRLWLLSIFRDRKPTPTVGMALLFAVCIVVLRFFVSSTMGVPETPQQLLNTPFSEFFWMQTVSQLLTILLPVILMTLLFSGSARETLQLNRPNLFAIPAAALLALAIFPLAVALQFVIGSIQPAYGLEEWAKAFTTKLNEAPSLWWSFALIAVVPVICEELAFRGYILRGLMADGHKWRAIIITSFFFGFVHFMLLQQINAFFVGLVLGFIAVQTGSIWVPITYHLVHNSTTFFAERSGLLETIVHDDFYAGLTFMVGTISAVVLLFWFHELQSPRDGGQQALPEGIEPA